jgi:hypothetical protein
MWPVRAYGRFKNALPWTPSAQLYINGSMAGGLPDSEAAANSCKLASPKRCKNASVVAKRNRPSAPANSSTSLRS